MRFKQLHFTKVQNILDNYEEANAGFITARIWERKDKESNLNAFTVVLDSGANHQLDEATVIISEFETIEDAQEHARSVAQEMFENYIKNNFLREWGRYE